ncbi:hypothetical protein LG634_31090 [Streptomyces bambusae]|uniref:hypothetical protein n=1 Tax=Streptomyces bambusae TaxID=1550616 RepID=UPI001CFFE181|nr:hypothetical protein [Streptomyces bambusae]MCB5169243.1 hypothetical protein [Streptomyces bambusae]
MRTDGPVRTDGPAARTAPAATAAGAAAVNLPMDADVVSVGDTGYLTTRPGDTGPAVLEWHRFSDGSVVRVGTDVTGLDTTSQLVGAGDVTGDGRPDLIAYVPSGTSVYRSTGTATAPFSRRTTPLHAGEGGRFNSLA